MCRFALYLGPPIRLCSLITEPANSIIRQSFKSREGIEPLNGDGFGVAWYVPEISPEPAVFKDITPAWSNLNLLDLARVTVSGSILAHVRAASPGMDVARRNCHPFSHGPFAFMHNGVVKGFHRLRRRLLARLSDEAFAVISGTTDSEHLFALFLDRYRERRDLEGAQRLGAALGATISEALELAAEAEGDGPTFLNLAVTDGRRAAVARATDRQALSLYLRRGSRYICRDGDLKAEAPEANGSVLIASEPLTDDPDWDPVPVNHLLLVDEARKVTALPLEEALAPAL